MAEAWICLGTWLLRPVRLTTRSVSSITRTPHISKILGVAKHIVIISNGYPFHDARLGARASPDITLQ